MSAIEKFQVKSQRPSVDAAAQPKRLRPVSGRSLQQKQPIVSSDNVFSRLRSNAFSMKQKLSRARQNITVKIEDLKKLKEDNQTTRSRINEIKGSIASLNAQITQRGSSLSEFKHKSELFHEMSSSAEAVFRRNDERLEAVDRCLRRLESDARKLSNFFEVSSNRLQKLKSKQISDSNLLQLSKESHLKVDIMIQDIVSLATLCNSGILDSTYFSDRLLETKTTIGKQLIECRSVRDDLKATTFSKRPTQVLEDEIATIEGKVKGLNAIINQLVADHGNMLDFEQSIEVASTHLEDLNQRRSLVEIALEEIKDFDRDLVNNTEHIHDRIGQAEIYRDVLVTHLDKDEQELKSNADTNSEEMELSLRLKNICVFRENREIFVSSHVQKLQDEVLMLSTSAKETSVWLDRYNQLKQQLRPTIIELTESQMQLAGDLAATFELVEQVSLANTIDREKLKAALSLLSAKLTKELNKKQRHCSLQAKEKIAKWLQDKQEFLCRQMKLLQQKRAHIRKVCDEKEKKINKLAALIRDCEQSNSIISEEIRSNEAADKEQKFSFEKEIKRQKDDFEKNLSDLRTKKVLKQFEREFSRIIEFQEHELDNKAKQLNLLKNRAKNNTLRITVGGLGPEADTAESRINGGRECLGSEISQDDDPKKETGTSITTQNENGTQNIFTGKVKQNTNRRSLRGRNKPHGCKDDDFNKVAVRANRSKNVSRTRHRRQAVRECESVNKPSLTSNSQELDPFAFT